MTTKDLLWPDCWLCRTLRASISIATAFVLLTYAWQLIQITVEMNRLERNVHVSRS